MSKNPLVSIIVPCYNVEKYINKCIESIIEQTYKHLEIWLVDDGGTDNSGAICDKWAQRDNRIKVIHKENGGLSDARNVAIDKMSGEWVVFIDSDDYVSNDYVETLLYAVLNNEAQIGVGQYVAFKEGSEPVINQQKYEEKVFDSVTSVEKMFYQELFDTSAWCKIYHCSLFADGIRYPKGLLYEDLPTTYRLMLKANKVVFCRKKTYYYLLRRTSIEGQPFSVKKLESAVYILEYIQHNATNFDKLEQAIRCRLLSFCLHVLLEMPVGYKEPKKQILIDYVKRNRMKVILNPRARGKARMACIVSLGGLEVMKRLLAKVKTRNK